MAVDHRRPLPVAPERLNAITNFILDRAYVNLNWQEKMQIMQIALQAEQLESSKNIEFFLSEAYEIYNARFR